MIIRAVVSSSPPPRSSSFASPPALAARSSIPPPSARGAAGGPGATRGCCVKSVGFHRHHRGAFARAMATAAGGDARIDDRDTEDLIERKKATRKRVRAALKELTEEQMSTESAQICAGLLSTLQIFTTENPGGRPVRLGLYVHCAKLREVDTRPLLETALGLPNCEVYVPIVDEAKPGEPAGPAMRFLQIRNLDDDLERKTMGIMEPKEFLADGVTRRQNLEHLWDVPESNPRPLDVLLIPGLAFDPAGARCGRGGGYYDAFVDRYFSRCVAAGHEPPPLVALAFGSQVLPVGEIPMARWDRRVDALATADGVFSCGSSVGGAVSLGARWRGAGEGWER